MRRDSAGTNLPDGYPTSTGQGHSGSGPTIKVKDEAGNVERIPATAVEARAIALADGDTPRDQHRALTRRAASALEAAVMNVNTLISALDSVDDLTRDDIGPAPRTCAHCTGKRGPNGDRPIYATGTVGDRLERALALCRDCHRFVEQSAKPATRLGRLPTDEQIRWHEDRGRWRMHDVA